MQRDISQGLIACLIEDSEGGLSEAQVERFIELYESAPDLSHEELEKALALARFHPEPTALHPEAPWRDPAFMSHACLDISVSIDLLNLCVWPRNIVARQGQHIRFCSARDAGRVSSPFLEITKCEVTEHAVPSTEGNEQSGQRQQQQQEVEFVFRECENAVEWSYSGALPSDAVDDSGGASSSAAASVWTPQQAGYFGFRSEIYPFIRGVITVLMEDGCKPPTGSDGVSMAADGIGTCESSPPALGNEETQTAHGSVSACEVDGFPNQVRDEPSAPQTTSSNVCSNLEKPLKPALHCFESDMVPLTNSLSSKEGAAQTDPPKVVARRLLPSPTASSQYARYGSLLSKKKASAAEPVPSSPSSLVPQPQSAGFDQPGSTAASHTSKECILETSGKEMCDMTFMTWHDRQEEFGSEDSFESQRIGEDHADNPYVRLRSDDGQSDHDEAGQPCDASMGSSDYSVQTRDGSYLTKPQLETAEEEYPASLAKEEKVSGQSAQDAHPIVVESCNGRRLSEDTVKKLCPALAPVAAARVKLATARTTENVPDAAPMSSKGAMSNKGAISSKGASLITNETFRLPVAQKVRCLAWHSALIVADQEQQTLQQQKQANLRGKTKAHQRPEMKLLIQADIAAFWNSMDSDEQFHVVGLYFPRASHSKEEQLRIGDDLVQAAMERFPELRHPNPKLEYAAAGRKLHALVLSSFKGLEAISDEERMLQHDHQPFAEDHIFPSWIDLLRLLEVASENTCFSSSSTVEELLSPDCCPLPGGGLAEATLALLMEMCLRIALQKHTPRKPATSTHDANLDAIAKNKDKKKRRKAKKVGGGDAPLQAEATLLPLLITEDSHDLALASSVRLAAYPGRETDCNPTSSMTSVSVRATQQSTTAISSIKAPRKCATAISSFRATQQSTTSISSVKAPRECSTVSSSFRAPQTEHHLTISSSKAPRECIPQPAVASGAPTTEHHLHQQLQSPVETSQHQSPEKVCHVHQQLQSTHKQSTTSISSIKAPRKCATSISSFRAPQQSTTPSAASKPEKVCHVHQQLQSPTTEHHLHQQQHQSPEKVCHVHQQLQQLHHHQTASVAQASALSLSTGRQATVSSKQAKGSIKSKPEISRKIATSATASWGGLNERPDGCHDKDYNLRSTDHKSKRVIGQDEMLNTSCRKVSAVPPPKEVDTVIHLLQTSNGVQEGRLSVESVASVAGDSPSLNSRQECAQNIPSPGFSNLPDQPQLSDPGKTPSPALPQHPSTSSSSRSGQEGCKDRPSAEARLSPMEDHHSLHGPRSSIDSHLQEVENVSEKLRESTESRLGPPGIEAEESVFNLQDESETNGNWTSYDAQNVPSTNMQERHATML
eukprot:gene21353-28289_t